MPQAIQPQPSPLLQAIANAFVSYCYYLGYFAPCVRGVKIRVSKDTDLRLGFTFSQAELNRIYKEMGLEVKK